MQILPGRSEEATRLNAQGAGGGHENPRGNARICAPVSILHLGMFCCAVAIVIALAVAFAAG
jgi:hypothetical protein